MQKYIYHAVPNEMTGDKLIPLNSLGKIYPHLYQEYSKKYFNHPERPQLLKRQVPKLNCLWNDVIHFLPLHPNHVYEAIKSLGIKTKEELQFYKIPIQNLKHNKNAIYLYSKENYRGPAEDIKETEINIIDIGEYTEMKKIPTATIEYYTIEKEKGNPFGLYPFIPHLLSLGEVEINGVEIIMWSNPQ